MNYLRFGINFLRNKIMGKKIPLQINIHLTDICNLRCNYCYIDFKHAHVDMPLPHLQKILREARKLGTERISLEGGEPLVRNDIGDIVDLIVDLGMECNINTNGHLLRKRIKDIKRTSMISVSLDGEKEINDEMRGKGSFDKAIEAIKLAKENGIKVNVLSVLNKANMHSIDFMIGLARELGFVWVPTSLFFNGGRHINKDEALQYAMDDENYKKLLDVLAEKKAQGEPIIWSVQTLRYVRNWPLTYLQSNFFELPENTADFKPVECQAAKYFGVIQTNGDMYSCDPLIGYGKTVNCFELGLKEAFRQLNTNGCIACNSLVCTEYHHIFSMNMPVIFNQLSTHIKVARSR